ncbi:MAG: hypothetical protein KA140_03910 [Caldisericia bacterium]|nr:hypothetical protein [Caldisericia bacterium]
MRKLMLLVCLCMLPFPTVHAADGKVSVKPIDKQVAIGDTLKVDVRATGLADLSSIKFQVTFENRTISLKSIENGSLLVNDPKPMFVEPTVRKNGDKSTVFFGASYTSSKDKFAESGTFFTMIFEAIDSSKSSPINIEQLEGRNYRFEVVPLTSENSEISVKANPIKPNLIVDPKELDFGTLRSGEKKTLKVHLSNDGKAGLKGTLEPDNTWIEVDPAKFESDELDISITVQPVVGLLLNMQQIGYLQVVTNGGSQSVRCKFYYQETAVDDLPPDLTITEPKDKTLVNKSSIHIIGRTNPGVAIYIGNNQKDVAADGSFDILYDLHEGQNTIKVTAKKDTGKTTDSVVNVTLDSMAPSLTVKDPGTIVHSSPIWIEGATEKTAIIRANGKNNKPDNNGNFKIAFDLKAGENKLELFAVDEAGNSTPWGKVITFVPQEIIRVRMWVGKPEAYVNDQLEYLKVPPTIKNGKTFVPLRFVSDRFKATVNWDPKTRSVTVKGQKHTSTVFVDSKNAFLDGQPKLLEAAPFITNGSTMVPLRFIAQDTLTALIDWDANEKRIDLILTIDISTP